MKRPQVVVRAEKGPSCLRVDASAVHLTGTHGADILIHVDEEELRAQGTTLALRVSIRRFSRLGHMPA